MTKKDKIRIGAVILLLVLNVAYVVLIRNWIALMWVVGAAYFYYQAIDLVKECMDRDEQIRFLTENKIRIICDKICSIAQFSKEYIYTTTGISSFSSYYFR